MQLRTYRFLPVVMIGIATLFAPYSLSAHAKGFTVSGRELKDANGNAFFIRGVSNPHIWIDKQAFDVLPVVAALKANCVRIVWDRSGSPARLDQIFQRCEDLKMVPMVELHDGTGNNNPQALIDNANYYARSDVLAVLKKHQRDVLINIANEWSNWRKSASDWRDQYEAPIAILRKAGIVTTLVVDNPNYAQDYHAGITTDPGSSIPYSQQLLDFDPRHNLLFSVHMYAGFNNPQDVYDAMLGYYKARLPLIIGEFGYNASNGDNNLHCKVDDRLVMQYACQFGYGYIAWSTEGNDQANSWLDLMTGWSTLTQWGNEVFYATPYSITNTAQPASIFRGR